MILGFDLIQRAPVAGLSYNIAFIGKVRQNAILAPIRTDLQ
jgi:hypothetical protein